MFYVTSAIKKLLKLKKRIRAVPGGSSAAKTIGILAVLIDMAQRDKIPTITSVVSESMPHLKRGAIRDFLSIMKEQGYYKSARFNKTDYIYTFETGSQLEFFSADQPSKVRGPRRDRLFINEANNVPYETFEQLEIRTKEFIFLDWNPTIEFWYYTEIQGKRDDVDELTLTYLDNEGLDRNIVASIESRKDRKAWWQVYGLGLLGEIEARIYKGWQIIDDIPHEAKLERTGVDFGYTNDPTGIVDIYAYNNGYIWDEIAFQKGLTNKQIWDILEAKEPKALVKADKSEPKSIDEIKSYGSQVTILPSLGGQGSVNQGISFIQQQRISVTKRSVNLIKAYRNYTWITDKDGKIINEPDHLFSHLMDAGRYAMEDMYSISKDYEQELADRRLSRLKQERSNLH